MCTAIFGYFIYWILDTDLNDIAEIHLCTASICSPHCVCSTQNINTHYFLMSETSKSIGDRNHGTKDTPRYMQHSENMTFDRHYV